MRRHLILCSLLLALLPAARTAEAQESPRLRVSSAIFLAGAAADWTATSHCMTASPYCLETNPVANAVNTRLGLPAMIVTGAVADVAGVWAVNRWVRPRHPRFASTLLIVAGLARASLAVNNVRLANRLTACRAPVPMACR
jgi:hypothetical protein